MDYIKEYSSNSLMESLHILCLELENQNKLKMDTDQLYYAISSIACLFLEKKDILENDDYQAVLKIANEFCLDVCSEFIND